jgi:cobalamin synthase
MSNATCFWLGLTLAFLVSFCKTKSSILLFFSIIALAQVGVCSLIEKNISKRKETPRTYARRPRHVVAEIVPIVGFIYFLIAKAKAKAKAKAQ